MRGLITRWLNKHTQAKPGSRQTFISTPRLSTLEEEMVKAGRGFLDGGAVRYHINDGVPIILSESRLSDETLQALERRVRENIQHSIKRELYGKRDRSELGGGPYSGLRGDIYSFNGMWFAKVLTEKDCLVLHWALGGWQYVAIDPYSLGYACYTYHGKARLR
ncbi:hypothetical protein vBSlqSZDD2_53 [Serratia phage vB_SlqS_ZDD2]|nr:hypothetical protein vBSlqSZDD2_53 [Serratia phage vB_SlqS_ZDD2]